MQKFIVQYRDIKMNVHTEEVEAETAVEAAAIIRHRENGNYVEKVQES